MRPIPSHLGPYSTVSGGLDRLRYTSIGRMERWETVANCEMLHNELPFPAPSHLAVSRSSYPLHWYIQERDRIPNNPVEMQ